MSKLARKQALQGLTAGGRIALRDLLKEPTDRNNCYLVGYISALQETGAITDTDYLYLMGLTVKILCDRTFRSGILRELERY